MSKHRQRVQFRRKTAARNSEATGYGSSLMEIYRRAIQGGSGAYLMVNQASEPDRIAKLKQQAQERRERRNAKHVRQTINEIVSVNGQPNGQPDRRGVRAQRIGKIRGFARRVLREIANRADRRASVTDATGEA